MAVRGAVLVPVVVLGFVVGALWWWAVLRLVLVPEHSGVVEGAVAAGGWGLSLLPVHATAARRRTTTASRRPRSGGISDLS
ncbi:hypothetical protein CGZ69_26810 [Streptomyces peucetius subsp. caesius ATCC 27952]|uniref:Uncharacterized protein n=1 Tax=Streptomyces xantholiticus TaxID=68285 RepID=A0ABV1V5Q0_9ACTN|nr:hypothetical protein [Streptomyces xantholiticus]ATW50942.1 hypothetical protein CGZ69_26810 [Streptomyces peucetius subsp. caesius ATCC 27952]GGW69556.1 hypothetical protein GCM10010381_63000 [Streptomyces xantholiticus]